MFNKNDVIAGLYLLDVPKNKYNLDDLVIGVNIELEHGKINPITNVTNDDLIKTLKIALAHLNEFPNYYNSKNGLPVFESNLKKQ